MVFSFPSEEKDRLNHPVHHFFFCRNSLQELIGYLAEEWLPWLQAEETVFQL